MQLGHGHGPDGCHVTSTFRFVGQTRARWSVEAQQRLLAVLNGECCFNSFKNLADDETHFCIKCKGRGRDVVYCSKECRAKHSRGKEEARGGSIDEGQEAGG